MAVTIKDNRTTINDAQATTNWTGAGFGTTTVSAEDTLAVAESLAIATGQTYYTDATARNLGTSPGTLVYIWTFNNALQNAWDASPPPNALLLGDGTDRIAFDMAGQDRRVFNHLEGPSGLDVNAWQCLVLDTGQASAMNSAGNTYVVSGSFAGLDFANVTDFGASFDTQSKALGGGYNVAVDIIRFGNDGIDVQGGTTGSRGTFTELATADRSRAADAAHGIFRALSPPTAFGCQGPMSFGDNDGTTTTYFEESNAVVIFEDRNISNDKYYINIIGNSTGTNHFKLTGVTITSAGPHVGWDSNGGNVNLMEMDGCTFRNWGDRTIIFSSQADATGHHVNDHTFDNCGTITMGDHNMLRCTISNPANTSRAAIFGGGTYNDLTLSGYEGTAGTAALLWNETTDPGGELDGLTATKGTAATHVIEFGANTPTSVALNDWTVSGYNSSNGQNDSVIYNNSNKAITVNVSGNTGTISYRNGGTSTTTIQASADYVINGIQPNSDVTILDRDISLLDITGTAANQNVGDVTANTEVGQSFQVTSAGNTERIRLDVRKVGSPTDKLRMRLTNGNPGSFGYTEFTSTSAADVDYVESSKPIKLESSSGDLVVIANVEFDTLAATNHYFFSNSGTGSTGPMMSVYESGGSTLGFLVYDTGGTSTNFAVTHSLSTATRYWLKWVYDHSAGQGSMWSSTDPVDTDPTAVTWTQISTTQSGTARKVVDKDETFYIGSNKSLGTWFDGKISYVGVWRNSTDPSTGLLAAEADWRKANFYSDVERDNTGRFDWTLKTENTTKPTYVTGVFVDVPVSDGEDLTTSYVTYDVDLRGTYALSTSTDYGIELYRTGANDGSNYYQVEYSTTSVHANGERWLNNGTWSSSTGDLLLSVMDSAGDNELAFYNDVTTGTVTYTHGGAAKTIEVIVSNLNFLQLVFLADIGGSDATQTVVQTPDLVYLNP